MINAWYIDARISMAMFLQVYSEFFRSLKKLVVNNASQNLRKILNNFYNIYMN